MDRHILYVPLVFQVFNKEFVALLMRADCFTVKRGHQGVIFQQVRQFRVVSQYVLIVPQGMKKVLIRPQQGPSFTICQA